MSGAPFPDRVRALICEDEPLAIRALREYMKDVDWVEIVGEARTGRDAVRLIHKLEPELVFMDIRMPGISGLEALDIITHRPAIVFTTAYDEYALPAFELGAVDYLLKPFGRERLLETLSRVRVRLIGEGAVAMQGTARSAQRPDRIFARSRGALVPVPVSAVVRLDATVSGCAVRTASGSFDLDLTLTELLAKLDSKDFVRVHRAHAVSLEHVRRITRYDDRRLTLHLADGSTLITSRRGSQEVRRLLD